MGGASGHEIGRLDGAQRDDMLVGAAVTHDADRTHRKKNRERLSGLVVQPGCPQLVDENRVRTSQEVGVFPFDLAEDADTEAGPRKRMSEDDLVWQSECEAEFSHLVLEEFAE